MSLKSSFTHRAPSQSAPPRKGPSKVWTIRALERDHARARPLPAPPEPIALPQPPEVQNRTFWKRLPLLSRGIVSGKS